MAPRSSDHPSDTDAPMPRLPLIEAEQPLAEAKPSWRGWIHAGTVPVALVAGIVLIVLAEGAPAKSASAVFTLSSLLLFGNSAVYHRFDWGPKVKGVLKRIDHANILLLIAGTYTPIGVLALPRATARSSSPAYGAARSSGSSSAYCGSARRAGCTSRSTSRSAGRP